MRGFDIEEKGLFTFYREQAEYQEHKAQQKRQKARLRKLRQEAEKKHQQTEEQHRKMQKMLQQKNVPPPLPQENYNQRAKKYIKDLEFAGKLNHELAKRQKPRTKHSSEFSNGRSYDFVDAEDIKKANSLQIIMKRKQYNFKFDFIQLYDKESIIPTQFDSEEAFNTDRELRKCETNAAPLLNKKIKPYSYKLPAIDGGGKEGTSGVQLPKKVKHPQNYYNPRDILMNNAKFKINTGTSPCRERDSSQGATLLANTSKSQQLSKLINK